MSKFSDRSAALLRDRPCLTTACIVGLMLIGQTELLSALARPSLLAIAQRVSVQCHLPCSEPDETAPSLESPLVWLNRRPTVILISV